MKAPVSIEGIHHAYHLTVDGNPVCFNHLVLYHALNAILIHHYDDEMDDKSKEIGPEHVKEDTDWLTFEVKDNRGHSHLVYYPHEMTAADLVFFAKLTREMEKPSSIKIPPPNPPLFAERMWSFKKNT